MSDGMVVFDTNTLISALLSPGSVPFRALERARTNLLFSVATMEELFRVVQRSKFDRYTTLDIRLRFVEALYREAIWVDITQQMAACRDPRDNKFLEVAVNGGASCIVTGDDDLLVLHPFRGIDILSPRDFLESRESS